MKTTPITVMTQNLSLLGTLILERGLIEEALKNTSQTKFQTSKILPSENGGHFFEICPEERKNRMIEFHQNEEREILLIFFDLDASSGQYKSTGEWVEIKFSEFDEIVSSSFFSDLFN